MTRSCLASKAYKITVETDIAYYLRNAKREREREIKEGVWVG